MRFYAISGSLRAISVHSALLRAMHRDAPEGVEVVLCDLIGDLPIFNPDREGDATPEIVHAFAGEVEKADALIIASPEYAHGIAGGLKNALDWLVSRPELVDKPVMLAHAYALGRGHFGLSALTEVLKTASLNIMPGETFSVSLVGKTLDEAALILERPDIRLGIRDALLRLEGFVRDPGES